MYINVKAFSLSLLNTTTHVLTQSTTFSIYLFTTNLISMIMPINQNVTNVLTVFLPCYDSISACAPDIHAAHHYYRRHCVSDVSTAFPLPLASFRCFFALVIVSTLDSRKQEKRKEKKKGLF